MQARSQKSTEPFSEPVSSSPTKDIPSTSTSSPSAKTPRSSGGKSELAPSKPEKLFSSSKTPVTDKAGEDKPRDLRRSIDGDGGDKKWSGSKAVRRRCGSISLMYAVRSLLCNTVSANRQVSQSSSNPSPTEWPPKSNSASYPWASVSSPLWSPH